MDPIIAFVVSQVVPGWITALLSMDEGEVAIVEIPPEEAYREQRNTIWIDSTRIDSISQ